MIGSDRDKSGVFVKPQEKTPGRAAPDRARRPRSREATRVAILAAVGSVLAQQGFAALGVNAVAREAGVDKVLIYRYFGGLPQLLEAFGDDSGFWPAVDEVLPPDEAVLPPAERLAHFLNRFVAALRGRPLTVEILAMEVGAPNALTQALDKTREAWGQEVARRLAGADVQDLPALNVNVSLLLAGIQYLLLRARHTSVFGRWSE